MFWGKKRHFKTGKGQVAIQNINQICNKNQKENRNLKFLEHKLY